VRRRLCDFFERNEGGKEKENAKNSSDKMGEDPLLSDQTLDRLSPRLYTFYDLITINKYLG
jgi:hypothetical protein